MTRTILMATLFAASAGAALAQETLPGNPPYIWAQDVGTWGEDGRVQIFASPVDSTRQVSALGVSWYAKDPASGEYRLANVRYPALVCGATVFSGLTLGASSQSGADEIDLKVSVNHVAGAGAAIGGDGTVSVRIANAARTLDSVACPG